MGGRIWQGRTSFRFRAGKASSEGVTETETQKTRRDGLAMKNVVGKRCKRIRSLECHFFKLYKYAEQFLHCFKKKILVY